jgi:hypothetical protein
MFVFCNVFCLECFHLFEASKEQQKKRKQNHGMNVIEKNRTKQFKKENRNGGT